MVDAQPRDEMPASGDRAESPDLPTARRWLERAAAAGDTGAMTNLGALLATRWDPPELAEARTWYEKAAAAGDTDAMMNLGRRCVNWRRTQRRWWNRVREPWSAPFG